MNRSFDLLPDFRFKPEVTFPNFAVRPKAHSIFLLMERCGLCKKHFPIEELQNHIGDCGRRNTYHE